VYQSGWSGFDKFVGKDDCVVLIPAATSGSVEATVHDPVTKQETKFTFETNVEYIITGRCKIWIPEGCKVVCVLLGVKREKG